MLIFLYAILESSTYVQDRGSALNDLRCFISIGLSPPNTASLASPSSAGFYHDLLLFHFKKCNLRGITGENFAWKTQLAIAICSLAGSVYFYGPIRYGFMSCDWIFFGFIKGKIFSEILTDELAPNSAAWYLNEWREYAKAVQATSVL